MYEYDHEKVWVEPWGKDSLRVRSTRAAQMPCEDWALTEAPPEARCRIEIAAGGASIENGKIRCAVSKYGKLTFTDGKGRVLLEEYQRDRRDVTLETCSALDIDARQFRPIPGGDWALTARFESDPDEKIFGMGQYQQSCLDLKGSDLELAQRNSQASVPFMVSSKGYGFLWNCPAVGRCVFGKNLTTWEAYSAKKLDYWITSGDTPAQIEEAYALAAGRPPMMPEFAMGFWQCKLRYQTQRELLNVAREYKRRGLPISVIVVDFFHWPYQGDWDFDREYWPDPDAMIKELREMGIELMVSVWPTVDRRSSNWAEMLEKGYLISTERGVRIAMDFQGNTVHFDATNPDARAYVWGKVKQNYYDKGVRVFWLDEAEPEYRVYDFDNYRYSLGPDLAVGNAYPLLYAKGFYDGMREAGQEAPLNLVRCAWAGSQKYGALVWSGDILSSFASLRRQLSAGLNMGMAGIPWWTTDIGGFHGGRIDDPLFRELLVRWFEFGTFCPVMRLHGDRMPQKPPMGKERGATCASGADNEVWTYGEEVEKILTKYLFLRERMRGYIREVMRQAHEKGTPAIRPLFYDFPEDGRCWEIDDEYMFGPDVLVAPVLKMGERSRSVYLPEGEWKELFTGKPALGGQRIEADAPLDVLPVYLRNGREF